MTVDKEIIQEIVESVEICLAPDGKEYSVTGRKAVNSIAQARGISGREVEVAALEQGIIPRCYLRNIGAIGLNGQIKLLQSSVAVVGAGGLGGTIIQLLARHGIGHIIVIDNDRFAEEDLNRQSLSTEEDLGEHKAIIAARRVRQINSAITVTPYVGKLTKRNARKLLKDARVVADGLDNLPSRFAVEEACRDLGIPFVYGAIAGFSGQLMTIFPEDVGLSSVYGPSDSLPERGVEVKTGTPSATPAMIAAWQVQEVIKVITGIGKPLRNRLLILDAGEGVVDTIELGR
ncbi:MAG: HesA/MoeB/ThiF family protein [Dehalococcoidia bacterium]|nr:HesA/MoeB/ThiF family protein [Dehalococcoidia bacterium]